MDIKDYLNFQGLSSFFDKLKTIFATKSEIEILKNGIDLDGGYSTSIAGDYDNDFDGGCAVK